jgi:hypothetical protein
VSERGRPGLRVGLGRTALADGTGPVAAGAAHRSGRVRCGDCKILTLITPIKRTDYTDGRGTLGGAVSGVEGPAYLAWALRAVGLPSVQCGHLIGVIRFSPQHLESAGLLAWVSAARPVTAIGKTIRQSVGCTYRSVGRA